MAFGLNHGGNADFRCAEDGGDLSESTGDVDEIQADEITRNDVTNVEHRAIPLMRNKRGNAMFGAELEIERCVGNVAENGAGGGILACAPTVEQGVSDDISANKDGVEDVIDAGKHMRIGNQGGEDRDLDFARDFAGALLCRRGVRLVASMAAIWSAGFDDAKQFDGIAQLPGEFNVQRGNVADAFDVNLFGVDPETMSERSKNTDFVQRVLSIDIERGFGFGVALGLSILEDLVETRALKFHALRM